MKLDSLERRFDKSSFFLKVVRKLIKIFFLRNIKLNRNINQIDKYSHCVIKYKSNNQKTIGDDFLKKLDKYFKAQQECYKKNSPFKYKRQEIIKTKLGSFGYDYGMVEYVNIEDFLDKYYRKEFTLFKKAVNGILDDLNKSSERKISLQSIKCYHYKGILYPRPMHIDTLKNTSHKIFFFLNEFKFEDGGYAIIPGSHNYFLNRLMMLYNKIFGKNLWPEIQDGSFYDSKNCINFCILKKNELVITKQNAIHGDLPAESINGEKTAIVFHCGYYSDFT